jgi:restriction endonuclease Mrr
MLGRSGDEGIDGIINEGKFGLDVIDIQAKRWKDTITVPKFKSSRGHCKGKEPKRNFHYDFGFFKEAREFTQKIDIKIILIDGDQPAQLLLDKNVGPALCKPVRSRASIRRISQVSDRGAVTEFRVFFGRSQGPLS